MDDLLAWFVAVICGLCYGTREIVDRLEEYGGSRIERIVLSGGLAQSALFARILADVTGKVVALPNQVTKILAHFLEKG